MRSVFFAALACLSLIAPSSAGVPRTQYDNDWVDEKIILAQNQSASTLGARQSVIEWADQLNGLGPWSVLNKTVLPPSGNKKDYMSWAPYFWPDCSNVGNKTVLPQEEVWVKCKYAGRDGQFNPDRLLVNDTGNFGAMADAVFYNTLAWAFTGNTSYSDNAARYLNVWFINPVTSMNPHLKYAQMQRGPTGQKGTHTGVLDLKTMSRVASALLVLRKGNSPSWTTTQDTAMKNWISTYLDWLQTDDIGTQELAAENNHGTFAWNQVAALYIALGQTDKAKNATTTYFNGIYQKQITKTGEQPLEAARTHPYHYRCYNIAAMVVNARLGQYLGQSYWNKPTKDGGNIQKAVDLVMPLAPDPKDGDGPISELYSSVAAVASVFGDPTGKYAKFLAQVYPQYPAEPYFLWNQPFSDSGLPAATPSSSVLSPTNAPKSNKTGDALSLKLSSVLLVSSMTLTLML